MRSVKSFLLASAAVLGLNLGAAAYGANISFVGAQHDLPGGGVAGATAPPFNTAGWRTSSAENVFAIGNSYPQQYYGTAGWQLFAATFNYPNPNVALNVNIPIAGDSTYQNLSDLPSWVTDTQIHATRLAGGSPYSLIDDPRLMFGERYWTFDGTNYPLPNPTNNTGQNPYVSIGFIVGNATTLDPNNNPDRWSFTVGPGTPAAFRVGIMNDGLNDANFASDSILMRQLGDAASLVSSGTIGGKNRQVDMVFFDVHGAQPGDTFVISASASNSRIGGISFDVIAIPEPSSLLLIIAATGSIAVFRGRKSA